MVDKDKSPYTVNAKVRGIGVADIANMFGIGS